MSMEPLSSILIPLAIGAAALVSVVTSATVMRYATALVSVVTPPPPVFRYVPELRHAPGLISAAPK